MHPLAILVADSAATHNRRAANRPDRFTPCRNPAPQPGQRGTRWSIHPSHTDEIWQSGEAVESPQAERLRKPDLATAGRIAANFLKLEAGTGYELDRGKPGGGAATCAILIDRLQLQVMQRSRLQHPVQCILKLARCPIGK